MTSPKQLPRILLLVGVLFVCIGNGYAFSPNSIHPRSSIPAVRTKRTSLNLIAVTDSNFRQLFNGEKVLLLDCCAQWCGPCKLIEPLLEQCAEDWKDTLVVGKFDVESEESRDLKVELILKGVMPKALPALILVKDNTVLENWRGVITPEELQELLENHVVAANEKAKKKTSLFDDIPIPAAEKSGFRGISFADRF